MRRRRLVHYRNMHTLHCRYDQQNCVQESYVSDFNGDGYYNEDVCISQVLNISIIHKKMNCK